MMYQVIFATLTALILMSGTKEARGEKWEQLLQEIYPAAKAEGEVIFNTRRIEEVGGKKGIEKFQKRFPGIKLIFIGSSASKFVARAITEAKADSLTIDAFRASPSRAKTLADRGLLVSIILKDLTDQPVNAQFNNRYFKTSDHIGNFAYNTELVSEAEKPKSYQDLLDPKWERKIVLDARGSSLAHLESVWGKERFWQFIKAIKKQKPIWAGRNSESMAKVMAGEGYVGNASYSAVMALQRKGAPIEFLFLSPSRSKVRGVGILKGGPHPNAAKLFLGWLLSPEGVEARDVLGVGILAPGTSFQKKIAALGAELTLDRTFEEIVQRDKIADKIRKEWGVLN